MVQTERLESAGSGQHVVVSSLVTMGYEEGKQQQSVNTPIPESDGTLGSAMRLPVKK